MSTREEDLRSLAEKQLGFSPDSWSFDAREAYLTALREHISNWPHDVHFTIESEYEIPRALLCLEEGCDGAVAELRCNDRSEVSFNVYTEHILSHPTHMAMRDERVRQAARATATSRLPSKPRPRPVPRRLPAQDPSMVVPSSSTRKRGLIYRPPKVEPDDDVDFSFDDHPLPDGSSPPPSKRLKSEDHMDVDLEPLNLASRETPPLPRQAAPRERTRSGTVFIELESQKTSRPRPRPIVKREPSPAASASHTRLPDPITDERRDTIDSKKGIIPHTPKRTANAIASGSNVRLSAARPPLSPEDRDALLNAFVKNEPTPERILPMLPSGHTRRPVPVRKDDLNVAIQPAEPSGDKGRDLDFFAQPGDPDDAYDEDGNYYGKGRDGFIGPQADEEDLKDFVAHANADVFDGNETVANALEELQLDSLDQIPQGLTISLMAHQVIGVNWMIAKEKSRFSGGCLADEMGLGKTIQTIATMVLHPPAEYSKIKTTLILAPLALLEQWKNEIEEKTDIGLKCLIYHGAERTKIARAKDPKKAFAKYDVVLTTYHTMALEWPDPEESTRREKKDEKEKKKQKKNSDDEFIASDDEGPSVYKKKMKANNRKKPTTDGPLFQNQWYRIVCDEAHIIKNHKTRASRAVSLLDGVHRWALTGTPIINSLDDAYPIFRLIKLRPWYDRKYWWETLGRLEKKYPKEATKKLQAIYKTVQLRRTKKSTLNGKLLIELPDRDIKIIKLQFSEDELQIYKMIEGQSQLVFNAFLRQGTVLKNYREVLVMLLRLRQLCSHPALIQDNFNAALAPGGADPDRSKADKDELSRAKELLGVNFVARLQAKRVDLARERMEAEKNHADTEVEGEECPVCFENMDDAIVTECMHVFCRQCIEDLFTMHRQNPDGSYSALKERECPTCRTEITQERIFALAAFEPTDAEVDAPGATIKGVMPGARPTGIKRYITLGSDSDIEMLDESDEDAAPRRNKGKGKARAVYDSEDDEEHESADDNMSDFIVGDDEDEDEDDEAADARRALRQKGKLKAHGRPGAGTGTSRKRAIVIDSDDEFEPEEEEVVFGKKKKTVDEEELTPEQIKLLPRFLPSTKMKHMMDTIVSWVDKHPNDKILVTSQWTSCLTLMSNFLQEKHIVHVQYRGNMNMKKRDTAVKVFQSREKARIMLMSTRCGGVGLNLTRGNRMICMDLAWSEAVENQVWSRIHRLGQKRPVFVERFVIENTIEERILLLQERKRLLAESSLGEGQDGKLGRLSVRDLATLFGIKMPQ